MSKAGAAALATLMVALVACGSAVPTSSGGPSASGSPSGGAASPSFRSPGGSPAATASPETGTGVRGTVGFGTCTGGTGAPCTTSPGPADVRIENASGATVASQRAGQDGRFRFAVPPGTYTLRATASGSTCDPQQVTVPADGWVDAAITCHP